MLKNLLVHLDQSSRSKVRLDIAIALAKANKARLVGVFAQRGIAKKAGPVSSWPPEEYAKAAIESLKAFELATAGLATEWIDLNRGSRGDRNRS